MARKRIIDPDFWIDEKIGRLDFKTMLLYIGLWNLADSAGIVEHNPDKIKVQIFPYKGVDIKDSIQKLIGIKKLIPYVVNNKDYILIKNFTKHQKERHPSYKYPAPKSRKATAKSRKATAKDGIY